MVDLGKALHLLQILNSKLISYLLQHGFRTGTTYPSEQQFLKDVKRQSSWASAGKFSCDGLCGSGMPTLW